MNLRLLRRILWAVVGLAVLSTGLGWVVTDGPLRTQPVSTGPASLPIGGPFRLTDQQGRTVTEQDFRGKPMAVFFGFTFCPDICPTTLGDIMGLMDELGPDADRMAWVFISVDSERDTPQVLADYLSAFDPRIRALSGSEERIAEAARNFRVQYRRVPLAAGGYTMDHSASVFLLDAEGRFAGTLDYEERREIALQKLRLLLSRAHG